MEGDINMSSDIPPNKSEFLPQNSTVDNDNTTTENISEVGLLAEEVARTDMTIRTYVSISKASTTKACNYPLCDTENGDVIVCGDCLAGVHFKCSKLPAYQIHRFLTTKNYRKYVCESCCEELTTDFAIKCSYIGVKETKDEVLEKTLNVRTEEGESRIEVIKSLKKTQKTLQDLICDKDEIIESQKELLKVKSLEKNIKVSTMVEKESNEIDKKRNRDMPSKLDSQTLNEKNDAAVNVELANLTCQLSSAEQRYTDMGKRLEDQALILHKTELAYESQTELLNAKNEVIEHLKTFLEHQKNDSASNKQTLRSEVETVGQLANDELTPPIPGLQESVLCLRNTALHGVILNGLLVWVNIQRRTTAENIWKAIATKHFTKEEITDAKEAPWDVGDSNALGKQIKRQGPSKSSTELDDISTALTILAEKKILPLFITTSNMLMRTPSYNLNTHDADNDAVVNRLKLLEDSVNAFIGNQCDHNKELFNKYEKLVVSRTAETTKLDEIIKELNTNELQDNRPINTPTNNDNADRVFKFPNVDGTAQISNVFTKRPVPAPNSVRVSGNVLQYNSLSTEHIHTF